MILFLIPAAARAERTYGAWLPYWEIDASLDEAQALDGRLDTAIAFATRYVHEQFHSYDEYVQASLEDFLNLQNGLFIVNVSNTSNTELTLGAPEHITVSPIQFSGRTLHIPVLYTFGTIDFYMERVSIKE